MNKVIYIDNHYSEEELELKSSGISTVRVETSALGNYLTRLAEEHNTTNAFLRGARVNEKQYARWVRKQANFASLSLTSLRSYQTFFYPSKYETVLKDYFVPSVHSTISDLRDLSELDSNKIKFPVFFRTELGSLLKKRSFKQCTLNDFNQITLDNVAQMVSVDFPEAKWVSFKEIAKLKKDSNGKTIEVRFLVDLNRSLIVCDKGHDYLSDSCQNYANSITNLLLKNGYDGSLFLDIAQCVDDTWTAIEVKNSINGTIVNPVNFFR